MKALRIILRKLQGVLELLNLLETEFKKIKRQKFILCTILAACLFPVPLTMLIVHAKLRYDVLFMFVMEFGFFLVLPIVMGIIATILFRMENENGTLKNLSIIPVPKWKLFGAKVLVVYVLAALYGIAAIGATVVGGVFVGDASDIPLKLVTAFVLSVLTATASLPLMVVIVAFQKNFIFPILCSVVYTIVSFSFSIMMLRVPVPLTLLFRGSLPFLSAYPDRMEQVSNVKDWTLPVFPCIMLLLGIGVACMMLSAYFYQKQEV